MTKEVDPYNLKRFLEAQARDYKVALWELKGGRKRSHWIWYIFPQISGLGRSVRADIYAIETLDEARAYLNHPILGPRLIECANTMLSVEGKSARDILGMPDDMKVRSCATLFEAVSEKGSVFEKLLNKFYNGERDKLTLERIGG
ncbi:DUF1810 domain-containing protein [Marinobacterium sp. D7]|uniref:DUF1810 domain-containing protein n=1 Tax=Marinobacterium ramblicola TaxID=2849041 RepID=UPI001C2D4882|nr:DUF1810 domain-containing protein [Marinobacterium ramblicola]MBV1788150.1 DUF1810 domain-containing protein [Marinobacterium ramblicola]